MSAKKKVFGAKKQEVKAYDDQQLEEILEQFDDDVDVILIKKPLKVMVLNFLGLT